MNTQARIGLIIPSGNRLTEPQFNRYAPAGLTVHIARARVAEGAERETIWEKQKQLMPGFAEYEQKTSREIPVVLLERV